MKVPTNVNDLTSLMGGALLRASREQNNHDYGQVGWACRVIEGDAPDHDESPEMTLLCYQTLEHYGELRSTKSLSECRTQAVKDIAKANQWHAAQVYNAILILRPAILKARQARQN